MLTVENSNLTLDEYGEMTIVGGSFTQETVYDVEKKQAKRIRVIPDNFVEDEAKTV